MRGTGVRWSTSSPNGVLKLLDTGLELVEIAPGLDLDKHVLSQMDFRPAIATDLRTMNAAIFADAPMDLRHRPPRPIDDRFSYDPAHNILFCNFEGLRLETADEAAELARLLDEEFRGVGRRVHVIVNYDNFEILPPAEPVFFDMIKNNERYVLSRTRYSTNAFFRRRLGQRFTQASLAHMFYGNFADARTGLDLPASAP